MIHSNWRTVHEQQAFRSRNAGDESLSREDATTKWILYALGELVTEFHMEAESRTGKIRDQLRGNAWSLDAIRIDLASNVIGNDYARVWLDSGREHLAEMKRKSGHHE